MKKRRIKVTYAVGNKSKVMELEVKSLPSIESLERRLKAQYEMPVKVTGINEVVKIASPKTHS